MRVCLMIEGQEGVTWEQWVALAHACEEHGFDGLFRSDHYVSVMDDPSRGSLDAWGTVTALSAITQRLRLGTLVSPTSFRHPSILAKAVVTADHVSGGRVELGIGAGWHETEHDAYGFPFHDVRTRMDVLEEQLQVLHGIFGEGPFDFEGAHYAVRGLDARPKPVQRPHPPIILGGSGGARSVRLAARHADEYNSPFATPDEVRERIGALDAACAAEGRDPATLPFSLMTGLVVGADTAQLHERAARVAALRGDDASDPVAYVEALRPAWVVGTVDEIVARLRELEAAGVQRVMLQHFLHDDLDVVELVGRQVIPALVAR